MIPNPATLGLQGRAPADFLAANEAATISDRS